VAIFSVSLDLLDQLFLIVRLDFSAASRTRYSVLMFSHFLLLSQVVPYIQPSPRRSSFPVDRLQALPQHTL
jgi:hypothetical protein